MVYLNTDAERLLERVCSGGQNHELLNLKTVASMGTTIDDVKRWDWHHEFVSTLACELCQVVVKWDLLAVCSCAGSRQRYSEDCIGADFRLAPSPLVLSAINFFNHLFVNLHLLGDVHALECWSQDVVDVAHCFKATLTKETLGILVAELKSFVDTC